MIITRSPLRISLGGGGTDLPSYYRKFGGFLMAGAIDKYVYITLHNTFGEDLIVKYAKMERVKNASQVQHPIIRTALELLGIDGRYLEISSLADIPAGTGLGSSGSFTTALLKALHTHKKNIVPDVMLAEEACHIEIDKLGEPIGKQDQYLAAIGGLVSMEIDKNGKVDVKPLHISTETMYNLEDNLMLFFTGYSRAASSILKEQDDKSRKSDAEMIENLHFVKDLGLKSKEALESGNLEEFARLMNVHWEHKKRRSKSMSNPKINKWYELGLKNGALGGKLIGAGGGGFLMFYADNRIKLRNALHGAGMQEVRFRFDFEGSKVVIQS